MSEYREALARMTLAIQTNPMVLSDAVIATEYHAAKALLARGEPAAAEKARELVSKQANDDGLWFSARTAAEAYLQQELRRLHRIIEG